MSWIRPTMHWANFYPCEELNCLKENCWLKYRNKNVLKTITKKHTRQHSAVLPSPRRRNAGRCTILFVHGVKKHKIITLPVLELLASSLSWPVLRGNIRLDSVISQKLAPTHAVGTLWMWYGFYGVSSCCTHHLVLRKAKKLCEYLISSREKRWLQFLPPLSSSLPERFLSSSSLVFVWFKSSLDA